MIKNKNERKKTIILPFSNCAEHPTTALKAMNTETKKNINEISVANKKTKKTQLARVALKALFPKTCFNFPRKLNV